MDFVGPVVGPIVQSLLVPVKKELGFLVSSTKYVKDMKKKMEQLKTTAQEVQVKWDNAVVQTEVLPADAEPWLKEVESLNERLNSIEAIGCFNVTKRYQVGKQAYGILEEIKDLENRKSRIVFTHKKICLAEVGSTSTGPSTSVPVPMGNQNNSKIGSTSTGPSTSAPVLVGTQDNFESRNLIFNDALQALQSNMESQRMIALCGMGGVGKTTMMEQLKKEVEGKFDWIVKVVIGENTDPKSLQQAIAEYIGCSLLEENIDARADRLRKIFEKKSQQGPKKNLVIIDDLWTKVDLKYVGLSPLPDGFKLLFTSRFENACSAMGVDVSSIFKVGVLSNIEAQTLFSKHVGQCQDGDDDDELQSIKEGIVNKCGGLPIAIVTIAETLRGEIKEAWQEALTRLERDNLTDLKEITHGIFEMSYENLKEDDKAIFLLCGLFPDDFNIRTEDLLRYGWGLRFFKDFNDLATARSRMKICVNHLIRANLLTESEDDGCVKMHDLVRAFVLTNFSKVKQASIVNHNNMSWDRLTKDSYERILLKGTDLSGLHGNFNYQDLSFLMLMDGYGLLSLPKDMHNIVRKLEVVSYENMGGIPVLLTTFEHSTTLRTLCLRSCSLMGDISSLGSLCNLETLSLVHCNIRRLPSAIGKLKKLKLLDLTGCADLYIEQGVLQDLKDSLEELYMRASKGSPVKFTPANCHELEELSEGLFALELEFLMNKHQVKKLSFKNLKRFRLSIGCELKIYENYSFRNTLNLVTECDELKECNIMDLFEKTEELRLQVKYMYHLEDVSLHHTFSKLRVLHISMCEELTHLFRVNVANGLKNLERLIVFDCPDLEALIDENSGNGVVTLKKLKFMWLEGLPKMARLYDNVIELPELAELRLCELPNITSIYPDSNGNTYSMKPLFNKEGVIPKLEKLDIFEMKELMRIWPCQISTSEKNDVSMLRQITVRECWSLINLFPINPLPLLNHLEEVVVKGCASIEVLFNIDFESVCEKGKHSSSRLRKIEVEYLRQLKELWRMKGVNESHTLVNNFKDVQTIHIKCCSNFTNIFTPITTNFDLGALTTYVSRSKSYYLEERERKNKMMESDQEINATYPSYLLHTCHHLQHLELRDDRRVGEVVFDMDSQSSRQLATIQPPLLLPCLESIYLRDLEEMSHVWKCNWNKFLIRHHPPLQFPFQNLTDIQLGSCPKIKYLFSPLMAKYLSNLKSVEIYFCDGIEEVISRRDDENTTSTSSHQNTTLFPYLDTLYLDYLDCLKRIDGEEFTWSRRDKISSNITNTIHEDLQSAQVTSSYWSLCQYPRKISVKRCPVLSSLIPWYAVGHMKRLQELKIKNCSEMTEVFENELMNNDTNSVDEGSGAGTSLISLPLRKSTSVVAPQLSNLNRMCIYKCDLLQHIFTISTFKTLSHLEELKVKRCKTMQAIVKEENETSPKVVLPCLETLELDDLPNLKSFFSITNDFQCPSLVNVMINDCPQLMMFTSGQSETLKLKYAHTSFGKYSLERGFNFQTTFPTSSYSTISKAMPFSFHNLIEINIESRDVGTTIIPYNELQQLEKLQQITLKSCDGLKEVFEVVGAVEGSGSNESRTVVIPNLTQVNLKELYDLEYLWKSNQLMVLKFPNLTTLSIYRCSSLEHVFTYSMVGSLVQLQDLSIIHCLSIEVIVKEEEEEECDAQVNEIMLPRLNSLTLKGLDKLKGFCLGKEAFSLPALDTLKIKGCPEITVFTKGHVSTPELKEIDTSIGMCDVRTDLNSFIEAKLEEVRISIFAWP